MLLRSRTTASTPARRRSAAAASPACPAPSTATSTKAGTGRSADIARRSDADGSRFVWRGSPVHGEHQREHLVEYRRRAAAGQPR